MLLPFSHQHRQAARRRVVFRERLWRMKSRDPTRVAVDEALQEFARAVVRYVTVQGDQIIAKLDIDFRLAKRRNVEIAEDRAQMRLRQRGAKGSYRCSCNGSGPSAPQAPAVGARYPVEQVFQDGRNSAIVLGGNEQQAVRRADLRPHANDRWNGLVLTVLIEDGQIV